MAKTYLDQAFMMHGRGWAGLRPLHHHYVSRAMEAIRQGQVVSIKITEVEKPKTNSQLG